LACKSSFNILIIVSCLLFSSACDESLPPRSEPSQVVEASVAAPYSYIQVQDGVPIGNDGYLTASLTNVYDDVLQKEARIQGTIDVWIANSPETRRTILLSSAGLVHPSLDGKFLTLKPGEAARVLAAWDQRTDQGVPFWNYVHRTHIENATNDYYDTDPIEFVAQASIQVFANVQPRTSPAIHYTTMYRLFGNIDAND
jgi:hypothetical protein